MPDVIAQLSVSLDGFAAGPEQSLEEPLGRRGEELHEWMTSTTSWRRAHGLEGGEDGVDAEVAERWNEGVGAFIMGRKMFGGATEDGTWDPGWRGWWGEEPPYRAPVFVLTHHEREPLPMEGGTTFHFITAGLESALERARAEAGGRTVSIAGGASTVNQFISAGLLDELQVHIAPILLGSGERLFDGVGDRGLEIVETVSSPRATHIRYRL